MHLQIGSKNNNYFHHTLELGYHPAQGCPTADKNKVDLNRLDFQISQQDHFQRYNVGYQMTEPPNS